MEKSHFVEKYFETKFWTSEKSWEVDKLACYDNKTPKQMQLEKATKGVHDPRIIEHWVPIYTLIDSFLIGRMIVESSRLFDFVSTHSQYPIFEELQKESPLKFFLEILTEGCALNEINFHNILIATTSLLIVFFNEVLSTKIDLQDLVVLDASHLPNFIKLRIVVNVMVYFNGLSHVSNIGKLFLKWLKESDNYMKTHLKNTVNGSFIINETIWEYIAHPFLWGSVNFETNQCWTLFSFGKYSRTSYSNLIDRQLPKEEAKNIFFASSIQYFPKTGKPTLAKVREFTVTSTIKNKSAFQFESDEEPNHVEQSKSEILQKRKHDQYTFDFLEFESEEEPEPPKKQQSNLIILEFDGEDLEHQNQISNTEVKKHCNELIKQSNIYDNEPDINIYEIDGKIKLFPKNNYCPISKKVHATPKFSISIFQTSQTPLVFVSCEDENCDSNIESRNNIERQLKVPPILEKIVSAAYPQSSSKLEYGIVFPDNFKPLSRKTHYHKQIFHISGLDNKKQSDSITFDPANLNIDKIEEFMKTHMTFVIDIDYKITKQITTEITEVLGQVCSMVTYVLSNNVKQHHASWCVRNGFSGYWRESHNYKTKDILYKRHIFQLICIRWALETHNMFWILCAKYYQTHWSYFDSDMKNALETIIGISAWNPNNEAMIPLANDKVILFKTLEITPLLAEYGFFFPSNLKLNEPLILELGNAIKARNEGLLTVVIAKINTYEKKIFEWLSSFCPDPESVFYMIIQLGYFLTGSKQKKKLTFLKGSTDSGKSTFLDIISRPFGEFAYRMSPTALHQKANQTSLNPEVYDFEEKRMITCPYSSEERVYNKDITHQLIGETKMNVRTLYKEAKLINLPGKFILGTYKSPKLESDSDFADKLDIWDFPIAFKENPKLHNEFKSDAKLISQLKGKCPPNDDLLPQLSTLLVIGAYLHYLHQDTNSIVPKKFGSTKTTVVFPLQNSFKLFFSEFCSVGNLDDKNDPKWAVDSNKLYDAYSGWFKKLPPGHGLSLLERQRIGEFLKATGKVFSKKTTVKSGHIYSQSDAHYPTLYSPIRLHLDKVSTKTTVDIDDEDETDFNQLRKQFYFEPKHFTTTKK